MKRNLLLMILLLACGCVSSRTSRPPLAVSSLVRLTPGQSTKADVLNLIGAPSGYGKLRLGAQAEPQVIWYYEYHAGQVRLLTADLKSEMLLVIFEGQTYVGHQWWASHNQMRRVQEKAK